MDKKLVIEIVIIAVVIIIVAMILTNSNSPDLGPAKDDATAKSAYILSNGVAENSFENDLNNDLIDEIIEIDKEGNKIIKDGATDSIIYFISSSPAEENLGFNMKANISSKNFEQLPGLNKKEGNKIEQLRTLPSFNKAIVPNMNSDTVTIFDTNTNSVLTTISLAPLARPSSAAMSPDGRYAYVMSGATTYQSPTGAMKIAKIDLSTNTLAQVYSISPINPLPYVSGLALGPEISPNGRYLVFAVSDDYQTSGLVILDTLNNQIFPYIIVSSLGNIEFSPDSNYFYMVDSNSQLLYKISLSTQTIVQNYPFPMQIGGVGIAPFLDFDITQDGVFLYSGRNNCGTIPCALREFNVQQGTLQDIVFPYPQIMRDIQLVDYENKVATSEITSDGIGIMRIYDRNSGQIINIPSSNTDERLRYDIDTNRLYSLCVETGFGGPWNWCRPYVSNAGVINVFDLNSNQLVTQISAPTAPAGSIGFATGPALSWNGKYYYYNDINTNSVHVIDTTTFSHIATIPTGVNPRGVYIQGDARVELN